ncbi:unnamed protein product [Boreogadus saida]
MFTSACSGGGGGGGEGWSDFIDLCRIRTGPRRIGAPPYRAPPRIGPPPVSGPAVSVRRILHASSGRPEVGRREGQDTAAGNAVVVEIAGGEERCSVRTPTLSQGGGSTCVEERERALRRAPDGAAAPGRFLLGDLCQREYSGWEWGDEDNTGVRTLKALYNIDLTFTRSRTRSHPDGGVGHAGLTAGSSGSGQGEGVSLLGDTSDTEPGIGLATSRVCSSVTCSSPLQHQAQRSRVRFPGFPSAGVLDMPWGFGPGERGRPCGNQRAVFPLP